MTLNASDKIAVKSCVGAAGSQRMEVSPPLNLLVDELQHRIRNLLTVVQCLVTQTEAPTAEEYRAALSVRIANLNDAYNLIDRTRSKKIDLTELLELTFKAYVGAGKNRLRTAGPSVELEPGLALPLHMVFHELVTNAAKYGALASESGQVEVLWQLFAGDSGSRLALQWCERGGPEIRKPDRKGFGLRLLTKVVENAEVRLSFDREGVVCQMLVEIHEC